MERRIQVGAGSTVRTSGRSKILAADGVPGVVIMLGYWAGGHSLFPDSVDPEPYLSEKRGSDGSVITDADRLASLVDAVSEAVGQKIGDLSAGSLAVYLSKLNQGWRANRQGNFPTTVNRFSLDTGRLEIWPRDYATDKADGTAELIPGWIRAIKSR